MADDTLPIVFRSRLSNGLLVCGAGALLVAAGSIKLSETYPGDVSLYGLGHIDGRTAGWMFTVTGAALALAGLMVLVRGCPTLTLGEDGIAYSRCLGGVVRVPWSELADVTVKHVTLPSGRLGRTATADAVILKTRDGRQIGIGPVGPVDTVADTIRRVAARMTVAQPAR